MSKVSKIEKQIIDQYGDIFLDSKMLESNRGGFTPCTLSLDIALHGGILDGTITTISGVSGSGKTTLCLQLLANAQRRNKTVYYVDVEGRVQPELLVSIAGLNVETLKFIRSTKEKFLTAEDFLNIITTLISSEPNIMLVLDSVAVLCDDASLGASFGESKKMMNIPSLMYGLIRKAAQILPVMQSNLILVSHIQANPSQYGPGYTEVGGNAMKYESSNKLICLSSSEFPKDGKKLGRESRFKILKAATGPGTGEATFYIRYGKGYDKSLDVFNLAQELGLIERAGAWYSFIGSKNQELKFQGQEKLLDYLNQTPEDLSFLENKIRDLSKP
jgi:recombination protein RecA